MHWKKQFTKPMAGQTLLKGPISNTGFMISTGFVDGEKTNRVVTCTKLTDGNKPWDSGEGGESHSHPPTPYKP